MQFWGYMGIPLGMSGDQMGRGGGGWWGGWGVRRFGEGYSENKGFSWETVQNNTRFMPSSGLERSDSTTSTPLLQPVQSGKKQHRQQSVGQGRHQRVSPVPGFAGSYQAEVNDNVDDTVDQAKAKGHKETRARVVHVDPYAQGRSQVADHGFGDPVQADVGTGKDVLQSPDQRACDQARNRAAAGHRKKDDDLQRKINNFDEAEPLGSKNLDKKCQQRNADGNQQAKPVYLNFFAGGQGDGVVHCGGFSGSTAGDGDGDGWAFGLAGFFSPGGIGAVFCPAVWFAPGAIFSSAFPALEAFAVLGTLGRRWERISAARLGAESPAAAGTSSAILVTTRTSSRRFRLAAGLILMARKGPLSLSQATLLTVPTGRPLG